MKKYMAMIFTLLLLLTFSTTSVFAFAARAQELPEPGVKVFGIGEIGEAIFEILLDEELGTLDEELGASIGILMFSDYPNQKTVVGKIASVTVVFNSQVNFSGSYITEDNMTYSFEAVAEDLGEPGDGIDRFSITLSDGYTISGPLDRGEIEITQ